MSSSDRLILVLNNDNQPPILFSDKTVSLGTPEADSGTDAAGTTWNTKVLLSSVLNMGYYGDVDVYYTRIDLTALGTSIVLQSTNALSSADFLTMLSTYAAVDLTQDDFEPFTMPTLNPGDSATVTLTAAGTSLGWLGTVDITFAYGKPFLNSVMKSIMLSVLVHPNVTLNKPNAKWLSSFLDFTSFRDSFLPITDSVTNKTSLPDTTPLLEVCRKLGFPDFTITSVTDQPTSAVEDSNTAFDRVAVAVISSAYMNSPIYLHHNNFDGA